MKKSKVLSVITALATSAQLLGASSAIAENGKVQGFTAAEICQKMGMGWNLGNTLDATGGSGVGSETSWGNPKTTKAMIDAVRDEGFTCVRIPTTWGNHVSGDNYTIDPEWMARVKEVVDYCIDDGLYVILNLHHDEWNRPTPDNLEAADKELTAIWSQIADEFKDYDQRLIFEGMNEPRNYGGENEWNGGTPEMWDCLKTLNESFVMTVRDGKGNNNDRVLMLPTYAASSEYGAMSAWGMENLKAEEDDRIMASVHAYLPFSFAFSTDAGSTDKYTDDMQAQLDSFFDNLNKVFISKGVPVCLGEFSATNKNNDPEREKWAEHYARKTKELGMSACIWDNNVPNNNDSESHGHLNRSDCTWYDKSVIDSLIKSYNETKINIPEKIVLPDLNNCKIEVISEQTLTASGYTPTSGIPFDFEKMGSNDYIVVDLEGISPQMALQDNKWNVWATLTPTAIKDGKAYFSCNDIAKAYNAGYEQTYGEKPSVNLGGACQMFMTGNGNDITVTKISYVIPPVSESSSAIESSSEIGSETSSVADSSSDIDSSSDVDSSSESSSQIDSSSIADSSSETERSSADIDGDGEITSADALEVLKHVVGITALDTVRADVNGDGIVNTLDALYILKIVVGLV